MEGTAKSALTTVRWNGTNRSGGAVPSGIYFLKVSSAGATRTQKLVVLK